jgi:hypothetical protein
MTQIEYIAILFDDCGFTGQQRRDFMALRFDGRKYADDLTASERSALIDDLKERKCKPLPAEDDGDEGAELTAKQRARTPRRTTR